MKFNPLALAFWALLACIGFLVAGTIQGAVAGLAIGLFISIVVSSVS